MIAVLPVAGLGTRLKPHTLNKPKALVSLVGKPILGYIIDSLIDLKVEEIVFIVGYLGDEIKKFVEVEYSSKVDIKFVLQEETLGLGHAVYMAKKLVERDGDVIILLGDTIIDAPFSDFVSVGHSMLGVKEVKDPRRFGVAVTDEKGIIKKVAEKPEKPESNLALVGLYYFQSGKRLVSALDEIFEKNITVRGEYQLTSAIEILLAKGEKIGTYKVENWYDCGDFDTLMKTNDYLLTKIKSSTTNDTVNNNIFIEPYFVGDNCEIKNSIIGPYTSIAKDSTVENSIIKNSIISNDSYIKDVMLNKSIIGSDAVITGSYVRLNLSSHAELHI